MTLSVGVVSKGTTGNGNSATTTGVATQASGSGIIVAAIARLTTAFSSIADNKGNSANYQLIGSQVDDGFAWARLYYCPSAAGGSGHTATVSISSGPAEITVFFLEAKTTNALGITLDKTASQRDTTSPFTSTATATTTVANELLLGLLKGSSSSNPATHAVSGSTPASGSWTLQTSAEETDGSGLFTGCFATALVSATGAYEAGFTESGAASDCDVIIATFSETSASASALLETEWFPTEPQGNPLNVSVWG